MSNADKAKATASNLWSKTKTTAMRTTQKVMVKVGKAEETIDIQYNQERDRFLTHYRALKKLNRDLSKYLDNLRDVSLQQSVIAEDFVDLYGNGNSLSQVVVRNQEVSKGIDSARLTHDEQMRADFLDPLSKYVGQCKEAKQRIGILETRKVDMDRYGRDVKGIQEKGTNRSKSQIAEQKYDAAKANYDALKNELLRDLPRLIDDRVAFLDPTFATYVTGMTEYYRQSARVTGDAVSAVGHVNRQVIHDHPRVITPSETSAATHKMTVGPASPEGSHHQSSYASQDYQTSPSPATYTTNASHVEPGFSSEDPYAPTQRAPPPMAPRPVPSVPAKKQGTQARALFDFAAQEANEVGFRVGDVLTIHNMKGDWWEGELNGKRGLLPSNYVQII